MKSFLEKCVYPHALSRVPDLQMCDFHFSQTFILFYSSLEVQPMAVAIEIL